MKDKSIKLGGSIHYIMKTDNYQAYFEANKDGWNKRTEIHKDTAFYDLKSFKEGINSLQHIELGEIGNVAGKELLHLQCHFGMDTLSWARLGAKVTGVDLSDKAIQLANELKNELNIPATFICSNIYDTPNHIQQQFDIVFTSYGVIGWLPDLDKWAKIISAFLKHGGIFQIVEFHPVVWMMDDNFTEIKYHYHNKELIHEKMTGTYADRYAAIEYDDYNWNHSLSEVVNALINAGLQIKHLNEFSYSCYNCFNNTVQGADGFWRIKGIEDKMPMMFSLQAEKK